MDVFQLRENLIKDYGQYVGSFIKIRDQRISDRVRRELEGGHLWPEPLIQMNPAYELGSRVQGLVKEGLLHQECSRMFRKDGSENGSLRLYKHQEEAIRASVAGENVILTTGTASGKSLAYIIPIVDHVLKRGSGQGITAIIVYPMNALANSQIGELEKFLCRPYPDGKGPVTFARYTGQEKDEERQEIIGRPPDILLTNYVMLELLLTRPYEKKLVEAAKGLRFLVLDELHTYRGRQGADIALLVRRARERFEATKLQLIGTSATLATPGALTEQTTQVAEVAATLFGSEVKPNCVIGETIRKITPEQDLTNADFVRRLTNGVKGPDAEPPIDSEAFARDPLSIWLESALGVRHEEDGGRMIRQHPRPVSGKGGAAQELSELTGVEAERCAVAIEETLLAGYHCLDPETGFPVFPFKLHQFISRGDTVYSSLETESTRHVTLRAQKYVPNDRDRVLLPLVFCRACGQEYYCVRKTRGKDGKKSLFGPRDLFDRWDDDDSVPGFLYASTQNPWPQDDEELVPRIPDDWLEERGGKLRVRKDRRKYLPETLTIDASAVQSDSGLSCQFIPAPFRFCLNCGVAYDFRQRSDVGKLATLGTEGRSTATTILCLSTIRNLELPERARKLLSFIDNRQDASLQAGHFNDFIEIGVLRAVLYKAVERAGTDGIHHDELTERVFQALDLPLQEYASDSEVRFQALIATQRAFKDVLGYRLYRDMQRGWRITSPNLEQCDLLKIEYSSLNELCNSERDWQGCHQALVSATPETRERIAEVMLDFMRRELAISVNYLDPAHQDGLRQRSDQHLRLPWAIDEQEEFEYFRIVYPGPRPGIGDVWGVYLSPRGGFGRFLRRLAFADYPDQISLEECQNIIEQLLDRLRIAGIVQRLEQERSDERKPGYQIKAAAMVWRRGDGSTAYHDPIRMPMAPAVEMPPNRFFVDFYRSAALQTRDVRAREHTAQVPNDQRQDREERFRNGELPILFCSPTMELGIDISELNVVNLRNVPPTPANYAQRSGRAGRSGQPALVFTYCSTGSSHDQYFFKRPESMVSGAVAPPRIDLANEDLVRAHIHAICLAETGVDLERSLGNILDLQGETPSLDVLGSKKDQIESEVMRRRAAGRAKRVLDSIADQLADSDWYHEGWLDEVLSQFARSFDDACDRWRNLYRAALRQRETQHKIIADASRSADDKKKAKRLRHEAEAQLELLTRSEAVVQSDFYSYRYFASEGFLPGYNFPRLPLSAYIPGRKRRNERDEFLSRPRFLAISEFGPRAFVYHEGSRYIINKAILPIRDDEGLATNEVKLCPNCGYLHPIDQEGNRDLCEFCSSQLGGGLQPLFRLQNVSTKRRDKISSDEEERFRWGYELKTGFRFAEYTKRRPYRSAEVVSDSSIIARMKYGNAATIWRINLGWMRRKERQRYGFILDTERGFWARNEQAQQEDTDDPMSPRTSRVIPYVEDRRNCLLFEPAAELDRSALASLQAALKTAIQVQFQLEDSELAAEPLPNRDNRRVILIYEAAEGGAGVLRRLVDDSEALARVAREALQLCHFDADSGEDLGRAPNSDENCEAACYDCLMSYTNQPDHELLDRKATREFLMQLAAAKVRVSPTELLRSEHLEILKRQSGSKLEEKWLDLLQKHELRLPSKAQLLIPECATRPDFVYEECKTGIYIDGPVHEYPDRHDRDVAQTECMEDKGYTVIRFGFEDDWTSIIQRFPNIFGRMK